MRITVFSNNPSSKSQELVQAGAKLLPASVPVEENQIIGRMENTDVPESVKTLIHEISQCDVAVFDLTPDQDIHHIVSWVSRSPECFRDVVSAYVIREDEDKADRDCEVLSSFLDTWQSRSDD